MTVPVVVLVVVDVDYGAVTDLAVMDVAGAQVIRRGPWTGCTPVLAYAACWDSAGVAVVERPSLAALAGAVVGASDEVRNSDQDRTIATDWVCAKSTSWMRIARCEAVASELDVEGCRFLDGKKAACPTGGEVSAWRFAGVNMRGEGSLLAVAAVKACRVPRRRHDLKRNVETNRTPGW